MSFAKGDIVWVINQAMEVEHTKVTMLDNKQDIGYGFVLHKEELQLANKLPIYSTKLFATELEAYKHLAELLESLLAKVKLTINNLTN